MKYATLFDLRLEHPFHSDGRCTDLAIEPSREAARLFENHRCSFRARPGGACVLVGLDDGTGNPFLPLPPDAALRFHLGPENDEFFMFTDLGDLNATPVPVFTNDAPDGGDLSLVSGNAPLPQGVLAAVEIRLGEAADLGATLAFRLAFRARSFRWAYYCVTDLPRGDGELRIFDASPAGTPDLLQFSAENRTNLDEEPDPSDPIAAKLAAEYPDLRRVRMLSDEPVACREIPRRHLELQRGEERLTSPLPNPSLRCLARIHTNPRQDVLFQILQHRTKPFTNP